MVCHCYRFHGTIVPNLWNRRKSIISRGSLSKRNNFVNSVFPVTCTLGEIHPCVSSLDTSVTTVVAILFAGQASGADEWAYSVCVCVCVCACACVRVRGATAGEEDDEKLICHTSDSLLDFHLNILLTKKYFVTTVIIEIYKKRKYFPRGTFLVYVILFVMCHGS
jgi:hypothetical protein